VLHGVSECRNGLTLVIFSVSLRLRKSIDPSQDHIYSLHKTW